MFNTQARHEREMVGSIQKMINYCIFNDGLQQLKDRELFHEKFKKYSDLRDNLNSHDESNHFGAYRVDGHEINHRLLNNNHSEIILSKNSRKWDHEFIDLCIEDIETEDSLLEYHSYDELFECNSDGCY